MRFREVFRFELAHTLRGAAPWVYAAILLLVSTWFHLAAYDGDIDFNAPIRLAALASGAQMFGLLVTAGLFGAVAVRDVEAEMDPLLYTSPLTKTEYLSGRFLAALVVNAVILLTIPLGQVVATLVMLRVDPTAIGPVRIFSYLYALPVMLLPTLLFAAAILFTIAMLSRQVIPVYVGAIVLFISALWAANEVHRIANPFLAAILDWSGIGTLQGMVRHWPQAEQNTRPVGFPATLMVARLTLIALAAALLAMLHRRFRFAHEGDGGRRRRRRATITEPAAVGSVSVPIPRVDGTFERLTWVRQTFAIARRTFTDVAANRVFAAVMVIVFGLTLLWGWNVRTTVFDAPVLPVTHLVAAVALSTRNLPIIYLLIALYAGAMVWKDRDVGMAEIADASPVSEGVALLGRFLAVVATLVVLQVVTMASGITLQTVQGYYDYEFDLYLKILFGTSLANRVLFAALAMAIHVVVNQKFVGHILVVVAFVLTLSTDEFGLHHRLLVYGQDPGCEASCPYSDMNGFGPFIGPFVWFKLYWASWAVLLLVVSAMLWVRGREPGLRYRLRVAPARFTGPAVRAAGIAAVLILLFGGFIFYNTNVLNEYRTPKERAAPPAEYEKRFKRFENVAQPAIAAVDLRTEIYPEERAVTFAGTYHLVNRSDVAIDSVHVIVGPRIDAHSFSFDRASTAVLVDRELGYRIFALERALEPGDSLQLAFEVSWRVRGFPNTGIPTEVVENGSHFNRRLLPFIGYQPMLELTDNRERERLGLARRPSVPSPADSAARRIRQRAQNEDHVHVRTTVGTAGDQTAITYGVLERRWTENGRNYFHYDTQGPESFGYTVLSGRYAVLEDKWNDVTLRIFHHPDHTSSLASAMRGMKESLDYFSDQFGSYPYPDMWMAEHPAYGGFGRAHPNLITFAENYFIFSVGEEDVDEPFYGAAHEVAHTWWGGMVRGARAKGAAFLSESLANYSAMILMEKVFGAEVARRVFDVQMGRYFTGRAEVGREVPVLLVEDQSYISYRRGALALFTLRDHIGVERVNSALRRYADRFRGSGPPYPTSYDLYAELRAATPDSLHTLLADLFETITLWNVRAQKAIVTRTERGEYEVELEVEAKKMRADSVGRQIDVPMDDLVEVGVFAAGGSARREPLYLERHRIRSGKQTIRITVPREPARAGIDPYRKLFDPHRDDNVVNVRAGS